jgi:hypothetical protein
LYVRLMGRVELAEESLSIQNVDRAINIV